MAHISRFVAYVMGRRRAHRRHVPSNDRNKCGATMNKCGTTAPGLELRNPRHSKENRTNAEMQPAFHIVTAESRAQPDAPLGRPESVLRQALCEPSDLPFRAPARQRSDIFCQSGLRGGGMDRRRGRLRRPGPTENDPCFPEVRHHDRRLNRHQGAVLHGFPLSLRRFRVERVHARLPHRFRTGFDLEAEALQQRSPPGRAPGSRIDRLAKGV